MIEIRRFAKPIVLEAKLPHYKGIYAIQSEVAKGIVYCFSDGKFAILRSDGAVHCPVDEVFDLAERLIPEIKQEILDIVEVMGVKK